MVRQTPLFRVCVHVLLAPPSVLGAWSMVLVLWLPFKCILLLLSIITLFNLSLQHVSLYASFASFHTVLSYLCNGMHIGMHGMQLSTCFSTSSATLLV